MRNSGQDAETETSTATNSDAAAEQLNIQKYFLSNSTHKYSEKIINTANLLLYSKLKRILVSSEFSVNLQGTSVYRPFPKKGKLALRQTPHQGIFPPVICDPDAVHIFDFPSSSALFPTLILFYSKVFFRFAMTSTVRLSVTQVSSSAKTPLKV